MADGIIVEGIKFFGGLAGLGTAAFTFWDRAVRDRPQVWVIAEPIFGSGQRYLYVVVRNPSQVQIRVTSVSVTPELFQVWRDHSEDAVADAWDGIEASAFIDPEAEKHFPICLSGGVSEENWDLMCKITVRWCSMRNEHIPRFPVTHRKTVSTLEAQRNNEA